MILYFVVLLPPTPFIILWMRVTSSFCLLPRDYVGAAAGPDPEKAEFDEVNIF